MRSQAKHNSNFRLNLKFAPASTISDTNRMGAKSKEPGTENWHVQVRQNAPLTGGIIYRINFMAKVGDMSLTVSLQQEGDPYTTYFGQQVDLTSSNLAIIYIKISGTYLKTDLN